jgi:hypothetical protein
MESILDDGRAAAFRKHLAECTACRREVDALKAVRDRLARLGDSVYSSVALERPVMDRIALQGHTVQKGKPMILSLRRIFSRPLPLTAASVAFLALVGGVLFVVFGGRGGYALAQTVEAQRAVRTVHVTIESGGLLVFGKGGTPEYPPDCGATEMWAELDEAGKVVRVRTDFALTFDGPKVVLWENGKASVWFPAKNVFATVQEPEIVKHIPQDFLNPNDIILRLQQREASGKVKAVDAKFTDEYKKWQNSTECAAKVLVVNPPEPEGQVEVYVIDPKTKLLQQFEKYRKKGSELVFEERLRFDAYNLPIQPEIFAPQLPPNAMKIDQTAMKEIGLAQGNMTDAEVAKAVVRQFFEALITEDYDKASVLMGGFPANRLKEAASREPLGEIISIGEPTADKFGRKDTLDVPYVVKFKDGQAKQGTAYARQVYNQPHRWDFDGGF